MPKNNSSHPHSVNISDPDLSIPSGHLRMGGSSPAGIRIDANSRYLTMGGHPWAPVMGEIHFSRLPRAEWRDSLLKMKAGGIQIAATYLFWNYHEETEGIFNWAGNRDLRAFVQLCAEVGLYAYPRIGPWAHGEARLGGFPDWLAARCGGQMRQDAQPYLDYAKILYTQIAAQLSGLLWKDGGPVVGLQVENELCDQPEHLTTLKHLAQEVGLDVPLYTVTGWGPAQIPADEVIPVFGGYPDAPWDSDVHEWARASRKHYFFSSIRDDNAIGADLRKRETAPDQNYLERYPYGTCELGGGVQVTYHRRPWIEPEDVVAVAFCKLGAGANMLGYYMYKGGTHDITAHSTLHESQETGYPNDVPIRSYDFQAPLGEYGQVREHYHLLRQLHLFMADFGSRLAPLPPAFPDPLPTSLDDRATLRWAVRSDGHQGFLFANNHQRIETLPAHDNVQFELNLREETLLLPAQSCTLLPGERLLWPFNLDLGPLQLVYASANLVCNLTVDGKPCFVLAANKGIAPELAFRSQAFSSACGSPFDQAVVGDLTILRGFQPGPGCLLEVTNWDGKSVSILVLGAQDASQLWKMDLWGQQRLILSTAALIPDGDILRLSAEDPQDFSLAIFPAPNSSISAPSWKIDAQPEGVFTRYRVNVAIPQHYFWAEKTQDAKKANSVSIGPFGVAQAPEDWDRAEAWRVTFSPAVFDQVTELTLRVNYIGDAAQAYIGAELIADDFWYGRDWEIGLSRFLPRLKENSLVLNFLPLRKDAPIYIPPEQKPKFDRDGEALQVLKIDLHPRIDVSLLLD